MEDVQKAEQSDEMLSFALRHGEAQSLSARLGELVVRGRTSISTPHYVASTSRGVLPHIAQDVFAKHTNISITYAGLEDSHSLSIVIEKKLPSAPIFKQPGASKLRKYVGLPDRCISILGPRRVPRLECPGQNTNSSIVISTSVGFSSLEVDGYVRSVTELEPDITTSIIDLVNADRISLKRIGKSTDRTHAWLRDTIAARREGQASGLPLLASIPPLEAEQQSFYLSDLQDEYRQYVSGLCLYDPSTVTVVPPSLQTLPRLCLSDPETPHEILKAVSLGIDLITVPTVTRASESGIALSFSLKSFNELGDLPLGVDLWDVSNATDVSALTPSCQCYTCTRHHRAYVHHLLMAKEMLAWSLLQIHNYHIIDNFFSDIRSEIAQNTFDRAVQKFGQTYQSELPKVARLGPRIRGYQSKSHGRGEPRLNEKAYGRLDDQALKLAEAESGLTTPDQDGVGLEKQGFAVKTS